LKAKPEKVHSRGDSAIDVSINIYSDLRSNPDEQGQFWSFDIKLDIELLITFLWNNLEYSTGLSLESMIPLVTANHLVVVMYYSLFILSSTNESKSFLRMFII
jgi:hypothetical protein